MKLIGIIEINGEIELITGLHIGSGNTEMHIGGTDNPVVKHPHTEEPYIPGSSLKGKMRSLLELKYGITSEKPIGWNDCGNDENKKNIVKLFGDGANNKSEECGPTRLSFYDCYITEECKKKLDEKRLPFTEVKSENTIDRITGTALHPRHTERVVAGIIFNFKLVLKVLEGDNEEEFKRLIKEGIELLEKDYLGGSGSRGYGKIKFINLSGLK